MNLDEYRELDREVATKVMGFRQLPINFFPSTDIGDAWDVVENLSEMGFIPRLKVGLASIKECPRCYIDLGGVHQYCEATMPLVICRAALKAVEKAEWVEKNGTG